MERGRDGEMERCREGEKEVRVFREAADANVFQVFELFKYNEVNE
jgi:hypothetical protein